MVARTEPLLMFEPRPDWYDRAECAGVGPTLFYNERGESIAAAAALCRGCEVREDCLHHALTHGERFGVWGGFSVRGRQGMRLPRRAS